MTIREMQKILDAQFLYGEELADVDAGICLFRRYDERCSRLLRPNVPVLMTGLCNPQVVRTAEMLDIVCIIFVRGKMPDEHMLALAIGERDRGFLQRNTLCLRHAAFFTSTDSEEVLRWGIS